MSEELRVALSWLVASIERDICLRSEGHNDGGEQLQEALDNAHDLIDMKRVA